MTRCLVCEIHLLLRIAMRFTKEAIKGERYLKPVNAFVEKYGKRNVHVDYENERNRFPAIVTMIVDIQLDDSQKRTVHRVVKEAKKLIDGDLLEEGFIEVTDVAEVVDLLPMEKDMKACKVRKK